MGQVKAWRDQVSSKIKSVILFAVIGIVAVAFVYLTIRFLIGARKKGLLKDIGRLEAQLQYPVSAY